MNGFEGIENANQKAQVCPFLGLRDDPATALSFPSSQNSCFHARPVLPVKLEFQRKYCLAFSHTICEEFTREPDSPLPPEIRFRDTKGFRGKFGKAGVWVLFLVFLVVALIVWQVLSRGLFGPGIPVQSPGVTEPSLSTEAGFQTPSISPIPMKDTLTPTNLATATPTFAMQTSPSTTVSSHALETPIGIENKLVIHRVLAGESIVSIANQYWTTAEAIRAVNYSLPSPLRISWLIIVPINQTDIQGLPAFDGFEVTTDITVELLAQQLSTDPTLLKFYNGFGNGEILTSGEWVLVPHMSTATP